MLNGYLNKHGKILLGRLPTDEHRNWVWAVIAELKERFPEADHWTTGGPDKKYIDIRIGNKTKGKKRGNPVFYFKKDASMFVLRSGYRSGKSNYEPLTLESAPDVAHIKAWFDRNKVVGPYLSTLRGKSYTPSNYTAEEIEADDEEMTDDDDAPSQAIASGALNRILYGPPGTGKTFRTVSEALRIIEKTSSPAGEFFEQKKRFDALQKDGRIAFVTFHQSFSYEDFIEGIRAEAAGDTLSYRVRDGIFKKMAISAMYPDNENGAGSGTKQPEFDDVYRAFLKEIQTKLPYSLKSVQGRALAIQSVSERQTLRITHDTKTIEHPAGRGRLAQLYAAYPTLEDLKSKSVSSAITDVIGGANITVYWAVLQRLLEFKRENWDDLATAAAEALPETEIDYDEKKQRVLSAEQFAPNGKPYVLIIDEINRGNMSRVFGELITLIEPAKRAGNREALEVQLPYSNERFSVPCNLYIIGTMNTADRSLAVVDTALRRRFDFIEMMPNPDLLPVKNVEDVDLVKMLKTINLRIEHLYDREHTIGHSFFMSLNETATIIDLATIFRNNVLPLLEEYFYEDWDKIGKILGKSGIYEPQSAVGLGFPHSAKVYRRNLQKLESAATYRAIYAETPPALASTVTADND